MMDTMRSLKREEGFTIQELLVVLIVASLLVSLCFSVFSFATKLVASWQTRVQSKEELNRVLQRMAMDVQEAREIEMVNDSVLVIEKKVGERIMYRFDGKSVLRNNVTPGSNNFLSLSVKVTQISDDTKDDTPVFLISLNGKTKSSEYNASTLVAPSPSSRLSFEGRRN